MLRTLVSHLSYANVMATVALFIALGLGTAYAAGKIGSKDIAEEAVKSKHIKNKAVKKRDLAKNAVTSQKVADGSLLGEDFAADQLPQGPQGEPGSSGATNVTRRAGTTLVVPADGLQSASVPCNSDERAVGGGHFWIGGSNALDVISVSSYPRADDSGVPTGWELDIANQDVNENDAGSIEVRPYVVCAAP